MRVLEGVFFGSERVGRAFASESVGSESVLEVDEGW